jgi:hypothetical protein
MFFKRTLLLWAFAKRSPVQTTPPSGSKPRNVIGKGLKELRKQCVPPITQDQLSGRLAKLGVQLDRVAIAKIETGRRCVFDYEVQAFAVALEVDAAILLSPTLGKTQSKMGKRNP